MRESRKEKGPDKVSEGLLVRAKGSGRNGADGTETRKKARAKRGGMSRKGESTIVAHTKKGRRGLKTKRRGVKKDRRAIVSLTRVRGKKKDRAFRRVKKKAPLHRPGMDSIKSLLHDTSSTDNRRIGDPDGEVVSIQGEAARGRDGKREIIDEKKEKDRTEDRALRNAMTHTKIATASSLKNNGRSAIREERLSPAQKRGRKTKRKKLVKKSRVPDRIKSARKIEGAEKGTKRRFPLLHPIGDGLRQKKGIVDGSTTRAETSLERRKNRKRLKEEGEARENKTLKQLRKTRGERDRAIGRRIRRRFTRLENRDNERRFPGGGKDTGRPGKIEQVKQIGKSRGRERGEKRVGDAVRTRSSGRREGRDGRGELRERERREERSKARRGDRRSGERDEKICQEAERT